MTTQQKLEALSKAGIQGVAIVRFTSEMSRWDPETFVRLVLAEWLHVAEVWVGANFLFGHERSGNFSVLRALGSRYGFRAEKIDPVRYKDFVVSSTRIRRLVTEGRVDEAGALLGHHYVLDAVVMRGDARVVVTNVSPSPVTLTVDGQWNRELGAGDAIEVRKADRPLRTFRAPSTFFAILRQKLSWGELQV